MLNILGAGSARPESVIDNNLLLELNPDLQASSVLEQIGIQTRRSILPLEHLRKCCDGGAWEASKVALESPTDLAVRAVRQALERAGITADAVGMVIGDSATPFQSAPSEGQRVAGRLGLKVPAYDVFSGQGPVCQHLDMLASWKDEELPDYIVCFSSNCPSYRINYRSGLEGVYLGDCAAALVVSSRHAGRLGVFGTFFGTDVKSRDLFVLDRFSSGSVQIAEFERVITARTAQLFNGLLERHNLTPGAFKYIGTQFSGRLLEQDRVEHGLESRDCWSNVRSCGYSLGASAASVLSDYWDLIQTDKTIAVTHVSPGTGFGSVLLRS